MLWPAPHPCQAKARGKAGGEELLGEERPGQRERPQPRSRAAHPPQAAGPGPRSMATLGAAAQPPPCLGGAWAPLLLRPTMAGGPSLRLPSHTPGSFMINSIIIQLLLPTPKYIAQSELAEIHSNKTSSRHMYFISLLHQ